MPSKAKPYEQFGPYILFKKLESDALGDLWRAARIEGSNNLGPLVALRCLTGGDRAALLQSVAEAKAIVPLLNGSTFAKHQTVDAEDAVPYVSFDYAGGRSLRHIVDRARGGTGATPNPVPLDQAVLISDRIALSLATTADLRYGNDRLLHGALIPQFVWITDDGEVRVAGQHLGKGLVASLKDARVAADISRYFSPEYRASGAPSKSSEVFAMGAMLFLLVTGVEPPDPLSVTAFSAVVRAAKTTAGQPIPLEIRSILDKSLILDPASRYPSIAEMKQALDQLAAKYSATTFNLAFYVSTLLKKEIEAEGPEREKEAKVNVAAYTAVHAEAPTFASAMQQPAEKKSKAPLFAVAAIAAIAVIGGAAFMVMRHSSPAPSQPQPQIATPAAKPRPAPQLPPPVLASTVPTTSTGVTATQDPNAAKKAFEDAVNQKLQQEMLKLQSSFNKQLQQQKAKNAPVATQSTPPVNVAAAQPAPVVEQQAPSAAALDERRLASRQEPPTQTAAAAQPIVPQPAVSQTVAPVPAPEPVQRAVQEGDVVEVGELDAIPKPVRQPVVAYPPMAMRQHIETSVIVTALVSENGDVLDVRVLRGDARFGFNEAAMRAMRLTKFSSPMKDGKRVKTWMPQTINFKM